MRSSAVPSIIALLMALTVGGCHRQPKPQPLVPAPMIPRTAMIPPPEALPPADATPVISRPASAPPLVASKPKPRPRNNRRISDLPKPATTSNNASPADPLGATTGAPPRITASSGQPAPSSESISEGLPHSDEMLRKQTAAQLNQSTEQNLRSLNRSLTNEEKGMLEQIRTFVAQSQQAIAENDLVRAHNLALKAHLLSDELAHR